ncbi:MAG: aminotransferase class V-fold PLP-dependent enzyme [Oscillospiraceae bacterium]|nr:aminotransferase class V-fold PLP-dependent enzyme [Oscillospiraceae bacterium]
MIYLDNAASTQACQESLRAFKEAAFGNPLSEHAEGRRAGACLERARTVVASALGSAKSGSVVFTSGGTESVNLAIRGTAAVYGRRKRHIVTTTLEHTCTAKTLNTLKKDGFEVTEVPPGGNGIMDAGKIAAGVREDTFLVTAVQVSSETGAVINEAELASAVKARNPNTLVHMDSAQGFLKVPALSVSGADLRSLSGHKIHSPKGIGVLYVAPGIRLGSILAGGNQENGLRAGTQPVATAAALAAAVEAWHPAPDGLMELMINHLSEIPGTVIIPPHQSGYIISAAFHGLPGQVMVRMLSDRGVMAGRGSACSGKERSRALLSMGLPAKVIDGAVRFSFSRTTAPRDVIGACQIIKGILTDKGLPSRP